MQQCGFCSMLSGLLRRAMCVGSRRGSSESYYRELGDQDTFKIEDKSSDASEESEELNHEGMKERTPSMEGSGDLSITKHGRCTGRFLTMHKRRKKRLATRSLARDAGILDDLLPGQVQRILDQSVQWNFNAFTLENVAGGRCLPFLCFHLFHVYGLVGHFKLDVAKVWKLLILIEEGYHSTNPYHNCIHAADVTQAMHCFLQQKQIRDHLQPLEILASLIAALAHDVDHPGVNQPFLIATSNHLAALYKNTSVLENHHWRVAISCLLESGLTEHLPALQSQLERQISSLILATDITRQQEYLSRFKGYLDTNTLDMSKQDHRHLILQIALKCADISNPCRPWEISRKWSLQVCDEFFRQGDYERKLNLPVTALCDRHTISIPKIQTGFFKFVVTPLIAEWHRFLQNDLSAQMSQNLMFNQCKWETLMAQELAEETRTEISDAELVEDELETGSVTNMSDSAEMLLPLRRGSLNPTRPPPGGLKEQLRRFSVPLNVFQDSRYKGRERTGRSGSLSGSASITCSEHSIHSQLSVGGQCGLAAARGDQHGNFSTERLRPDSSIASITTPRQATRLSCVLKDGAAWKLVRQQTFPPMEAAARCTLARGHHTSHEDAIYPSRRTKTDFGQMFTDTDKRNEKMISSMFKRNDFDKTDNKDASENNKVDVTQSSRNLEKENLDPMFARSGQGRRESAPAPVTGGQLRDNLSAVHLQPPGSGPSVSAPPPPPAPAPAPAHPHVLRRRKSMPADSLAYTPKEKKMRDMTAALPQLLKRTFSGKECWTRRRGSAPAPVAPSELRGLVGLSAMRHSVNGSRRRPAAAATCQQQCATRAIRNVQDAAAATANKSPRRSSLPIEVLNATDLMKPPEPKQ